MNCVHCGDPLPGPWRIDQEVSLPRLRVGSLVVAKKASGVCDPGERGVVYEAYELGNRPGWSVIFQSGRHDGFSPCDVDFFLDVSGEDCEELSRYTFENVPRLVDHFGGGDFAPALGPQGHRSIHERWFYIRQSDRNTSTWLVNTAGLLGHYGYKPCDDALLLKPIQIAEVEETLV